jgi:pimeloyl-ACP methyl ester carboxylesterase
MNPNVLRQLVSSLAMVLLLVSLTQAQQANLRHHIVEVDGHPIALWEKSPASPSETIVLIHGRTWSSLPDFDLQVQGEDLSLMDGLVAEGYATYAVDLRGYGGTPRDETGWLTPDRAVRDMVGILQWVGQRTGDVPALFGWSYGSMVAQLAAQRAGELTEALILFGYPVGPDTEFSDSGEDQDEPPRTPTTAAAAASDFLIPGSISQRAIDEYVRHALEADPVRVDWRCLAEWNELNPAEVLVPTLLIQGEKDPFAPSARQAAFFSKLGVGDRSWVTIAGGDHALHLETPRPNFIHAMTSFLRRPR